MTRTIRRLLALLLVLAVVAAACGSDDSESSSEDSTPSTTEGAPADTTGDSVPDTTSDEPVELTASYQGVTETEIQFGVAAIDAEALLAFGVDLGVVPVDDFYQAWSDAQNERGGVLGRNLVPNVRLFLPVGDASSEEICLDLADDVKVFVTLGQFLNDQMMCFVEDKGLPYIGLFGVRPELVARANGLFIATEMSNLNQRTGGTAAMIKAGDFEGEKVAITWENPADAEFTESIKPLLADAGVEVVTEVEIGDFGQDQVAASNAWDVAMQRISADGATFVLHQSNINSVIEAVDRAGLDVRIGLLNGQAADGFLFPDIVAAESVKANTFAVTTSKPDRAESLEDPEVKRCLEEYDAAFPDNEFDEESVLDVSALTNNCRAFALMVLTLEAGGGNLTPETWVEGYQSLGTFDLPAMKDASLGPDKFAAGSLLARYEYDPEENNLVRVGDPFLPDA